MFLVTQECQGTPQSDSTEVVLMAGLGSCSVGLHAVLLEEMRGLGDHFDPDELAYLTLTSKVEHVVRDKLAWRLQSRLPEQRVAREWKRTDIAVLNIDNTPALLLEAKALYSLDGGRQVAIRWYSAAIAADLAKARALSGDTKVYAAVLATHPLSPIRRELRQVVKYGSQVNSAFTRLGSADAVRAEFQKTFLSIFKALGQVKEGSLPQGHAFGVGVHIDWWLVGPCT